MKDTLRQLFLDTLPELDAGAYLTRHSRREGNRLHLCGCGNRIDPFARVFVLAFGKAARPMARALLQLLHGVEVHGLLVPPTPDQEPQPPLQVIGGGHPLPDAGSLRAAERALVLLGNAGERDLVIFLVSGGGSALFERPIDPALSLADLRETHRLLVGSGADIAAMNTVRKHLSGVKGGRLALRAGHSHQQTLIVSDVRPGQAQMVASGPTIADPSTNGDALAVLQQHNLLPRLPPTVRALLQRGKLPETPKPGHPAFANSQVAVLLDSPAAVAALQARAEAAGMRVEAIADGAELPVEVAAERWLDRLRRLRQQYPVGPVAVVAGGELSVPLPANPGRGGRNQQFALACARRIAGAPIAVLSAGTDGIDGNSAAAGAVADGSTVARAGTAGFLVDDHLQRCDAAPLFQALGDAVVTGPTGTNVRDLRILVHA